MIEIIKAIILGVVEGFTEFLPISSTGHLILVGSLLDFNGPVSKTFEVFIQLGAILAVIWLYRQRIWQLAVRLPVDNQARRFVGGLFLAFLPAAILGLLFHNQIEQYLFNPITVAAALLVGGLVILVVENMVLRFRIQQMENVPPNTALGIGVAQAVSLIPGTSRSAATIVGGMLLGLDRRTAVEYSFFLSIPTMLAATLYDLAKSIRDLHSGDLVILAVGFIVAFMVAFFVIQYFLSYIQTHTFKLFAWYRIVLGVVVLLAFYSGVLQV
ncbi:MAG: undecaprenyl-diphosphate phosphatase [Chloroflexi bacterium]|nr:undecaprenyl-diphosphate phosphatase [Chloroflexota bacterium]